MGTMSKKDSVKRAQQRADVALPIASDLSPAQRRARRKTARASQTTAREKKERKAKFEKLKKEAKPAGTVSGVASLLKKRGKLPK